MPAAGVPATFRSSAVPAWRKYAGTAGTGPATIPPLEELSVLAQHLHALQQDAEARARTLADERPAKASGTRARARDIKAEDDERVPETSSPTKSESGSDTEWAPEDARRRASVGRTYGRGTARRKASGPGVSESTELLSDGDSEGALSAQRSKTQRPPLGVKLRLTQPSDARSVRTELRPVPAAPATGIDLHGDTFFDNTTFSWDVPLEPEGSVLPKCEPTRLPKPYPTHPNDVHEDFSERDWRERESVYSVGDTASESSMAPKDTARARPAKEASQVPATTFFNFADAYFKPVTEDDLAWLSSRADDPAPFQFPELGPHYRTVWEKEDAELLGVLRAMDGSHAGAVPPPRVVAEPLLPSSASLDALADADMYSRTLCGGPLMERLAASLLLPEDVSASVPASQAMQSTHSSSSHTSHASDDAEGPPLPPPDAHKPLADMEAQARQACEAMGLLEPGASAHFDEHADGPIASALRLAQEKLRHQIRSNEQRKARLFQVAKDYMAYQDYLACLQAAEREIEASWTKRTRQLKATRRAA
ncbi:Transcriptional regulator [Malassezia caprae]|uniref:Transcriptional regulator n=1 Tax=Malassezia caprae TaxID=1381934 RepID=A0AAF0E7I9_9BASI|nr:Transcriptional regulator [Malassezia caprae]